MISYINVIDFSTDCKIKRSQFAKVDNAMLGVNSIK